MVTSERTQFEPPELDLEKRETVMDVNIDKYDAVRFYQKRGFRIAAENTIRHEGRTLGNRPMRNA